MLNGDGHGIYEWNISLDHYKTNLRIVQNVFV
jgi:hypothetical protein